MTTVKLYEFSLCPFCNKVRAGLEIKGIPFESVEVSPRSKVELPPLPEGTPKKVPVLQSGADTVADSTAILNYLEDHFPSGVRFHPADPEVRKRSDEIEDWVDTQFIEALPTVIYGTWGEAVQAARIVATNSKLSGGQKLLVQLAGALVMKQISKRILKRNDRTDAHAWVRDNTAQFATWLGEKPFVLGDEPCLADVSMHGALTCVKEFPIFAEVMQSANVAAWYERMAGLRRAGAAAR
jgi:microsomal prostaglandin-E synthase 2